MSQFVGKDECTLYVSVRGSTIPENINERELSQHFQAFKSSIISCVIVKKMDKRYAFIKFNSATMATAAMQEYQGSLLHDEHTLTINYGQRTHHVPKSHTACTVICQSLNVHEASSGNHTLFVRVRNSTFPPHINDGDLRTHFIDFESNIIDAFIGRDRKTNRSCGYGYVVFSTHLAAERAMKELQGSKLHDKFSLYISFDKLKRAQQLKPVASDHEVELPLQVTFERLLYLKHCFFISPAPLSEALMKSLPVKISQKEESIMLYGTNAAILKATNMIMTNPLVSNLKSSTYTQMWEVHFVSLLEHGFLNSLSDKRKDVVCILRKLEENVPHEQITFTVYTYSHDQALLEFTLTELNKLKPQSKLYQLRPEHPTIPQLTDAFLLYGKQYYTMIVKETGNDVRIHGIRADDIQNCWIELKKFVDSNITINTAVDIGFWQAMYLQCKLDDVIKRELANGCHIIFPSFVAGPQSVDDTVKVTLTGKQVSVDSAIKIIKEICSQMLIKTVQLHCDVKYINLWKSRWTEYKAEQDQEGVLVEVRTIGYSSDKNEETVDVTITLVGSDINAVMKAYSDVIHKENGSKGRLSTQHFHLNPEEFSVLLHNLKMCQNEVQQQGLIIIELDELNQDVALLAPPQKEAQLLPTVTNLTKLIKSLTPKQPSVTVKEISYKQEIINKLFLATTGKYYPKLKRLADRYAVEISLVSGEKKLKLTGTESSVRKIQEVFNSLVTKVNESIECVQVAMAKHYYPILSTDSFKTFLSELQRDTVLHQCTKRVVRQAVLKSKVDQSILLKIAVGSLASEAVDATVVPAGTQDTSLANIEMIEIYEEYVQRKNKIMNNGDVLCLSSGSFPSKMTLHIALPRSDDLMDFTLICWSCLKQAAGNNLKSLSFGVGDWKYTKTFVTGLLYCINHLCSQSRAVSINSITVVITSDSTEKLVLETYDNFGFKSQGDIEADTQPRWYWYDRKQYIEYSKEISTKLSQASEANPIGMCYFQISGKCYTVDLSRMIQRNMDTHHIRKVLCKKSSMASKSSQGITGHALQLQSCAALKPAPLVRWYYKDDTCSFEPYCSCDSDKIESMFQNHSLRENLIIQSRSYKFDFVRMKQINCISGYERDIEREEVKVKDTSTQYSNDSECTLPITEYYINIRGLRSDLLDVKQRIVQKLNQLCVTKVVQLPATSTQELVQKLNTIARNRQVCVKQSTSCPKLESTSNDCGYITIEGEEHLVHKCVTEVQEEIIKFQSLTALVQYPPEWEPCSNTTDVIELHHHSEERNRIEQKFNETVHEAKITSIKRIQNKWLWENYTQAKKRMHKKNSGAVNEMELWHGSRTTSAENIYDSEEGFDMRHSSVGMWGRANYFAVDASYSVKYAFHHHKDDTKELLLAKVLTGDSFECPPDKLLCMPPEKANSKVKLKQVRYDSVNGVTRNCRVYMTYSNDKAYPAYLIRFSMASGVPPLSSSAVSHPHNLSVLLARLNTAGFKS